MGSRGHASVDGIRSALISFQGLLRQAADVDYIMIFPKSTGRVRVLKRDNFCDISSTPTAPGSLVHRLDASRWLDQMPAHVGPRGIVVNSSFARHAESCRHRLGLGGGAGLVR